VNASLAAVAGGIVLLAVAADQFVVGAARVAVLKKVPPLLVGVLIIGFGTSAPELLVSVLAAVGGEPEVGFGNIVGSNLVNLTLLLGVAALLLPLAIDSLVVRREAPIAVGAMLLLLLAAQGGGVSRVEGAVLLAAMVGVVAVLTRRQPGDPLSEETVEFADASTHRFGVEVARTVVGLAGTIGGAQLLLWGAVDLADRAGLSAGFVGVSMVAVGTSLPELVTVLQSARRNETDLIVGNLLGSNLFNTLVVGGAVGLIADGGLDDPALTLIAPLAAVAAGVIATVLMRTGHVLTRREGALLVVGYLAVLPVLL
jgi:cation:H+ antiporter